MPAAAQEPLLTSAQVAALLRVHPKHIYRLLKRGLPARRVGGAWRFRRDEVLAWSSSAGTVAPAEGAPTGSPRGSLLAANGDVVIELLLASLCAQRPDAALWGFVAADRTQALAWLTEGRVQAAGSHGGLPPTRAGSARLARVHLVEREIGLASKKSAPTVGALAGLRLATRPATAGVSAHLDEALRAARVSRARALARAVEHPSHAAVVAAVLRGEADAGLTTRAMAARFGLAFRAIAAESYGLLVRSEALGAPDIVRLCEVAQSKAYRAALDAVPGYDPAGAGDLRYDPEPGQR